MFVFNKAKQTIKESKHTALCPDKEAGPEEMSIPGLDWGMEEVMGKDNKRVPQKKVPYAKPIPAQFQQVSLCLSIAHLVHTGQSVAI